MTFNSAEEKYIYVNDMFARIAERYDLMNKLMTGGQDVRWRRLVVEAAQLPHRGGSLLDIATGTGDIAFEALRRHAQLDVVIGADFTLPMMQIGQRRAGQKPVRWSGADALHLPFPDNAFEAVVSGFLMRNVVNVTQALREQHRVCKPGGRVVILEIPRPPDTLLGQLFRTYFHHVVPRLGSLISGQPDAYRYLPSSADTFLSSPELRAKMETVGLSNVSYRMLMMGTVALHMGEKT